MKSVLIDVASSISFECAFLPTDKIVKNIVEINHPLNARITYNS